jgi:hypothetical protein
MSESTGFGNSNKNYKKCDQTAGDVKAVETGCEIKN